MNNKRMMLGVLSFVIVLAVFLTGHALVKRRNRKKNDNHKKEDENIWGTASLDKIYDYLLNFDEESETTNDSPVSQSPKPVVMKLKDRTFWSIYKGIIISGLIIILFAAIIAIVSVMGQNSYADRKQSEEKAQKEQQLIDKDAERNRIGKEEERMIELSLQLDSIDTHIKQLRPIPKQTIKKKSGR